MIDTAKWDAVPAVEGPPIDVGVCETCGAAITKQFVSTRVLLGRSIHVFNVTCSKGGDEHVMQEPTR